MYKGYFSKLCIHTAALIGGAALLTAQAAVAQSLLPDVKSPIPRSPVIDKPSLSEAIVHRPVLIDGMIKVHCQRVNTQIEIIDEDAMNQVFVTLNDRRYTFTSDQVQGFDLKLCGPSNSVTYQVGEVPVLTRHRRFNIQGVGYGFDTVRLDFANAIGARALQLDVPPTINLDMGPLADIVGIEVRDFPAGLFLLNADMGAGSDSFYINPYGGDIKGSIHIAVDGGKDDSHAFYNDGGVLDIDSHLPGGDKEPDTIVSIYNPGDTIDVNLASQKVAYDIPQGSVVSIFVWGDSREGLGPFDNIADHGMDVLVVRWEGKLNGHLNSYVYGDDQQFRAFNAPDFGYSAGGECWRSAAPAFGDYANDRVCALEDALFLVPFYASDSVQTRYTIDANSTGSAVLRSDGGVGDDAVVLQFLHKDALDYMQSLDAEVTGGQHYPNKLDTCAADHPSIVLTECDLIDSSISAVD